MVNMQVNEDPKPSGLAPPEGGPARTEAASVSTEAQAGLLAGMRRKDRQAFAMVIQQFSAVLTKSAYVYLGDGHDAEDAVQETFLAAWDASGRTGEGTNLSHWLFGILMNRCRKHIRSAGRRRRRDRQAFLDRREALARAGEGVREGSTDVRDALAVLGPEHREAIILRYYQGLSVSQAAAALGIPPGTVKSRCHVAILRLRSIIEAGA